MANCTFCGKPIVLVPSAAERAAKDRSGNTAAYYTSLFTSHSDCLMLYRDGHITRNGKRYDGPPSEIG